MKLIFFPSGFLLILALATTAATLSARQPSPSDGVLAWSRVYRGHIGTKPVEIQLSRVGDKVSGNYCYGTCGSARAMLSLEGTIWQNSVTLEETDYAVGPMVKGRWLLTLSGPQATGTWSSPDGQRRLRISLAGTSPFPFDIRLSRRHAKRTIDSICVIRLYRAGKLVQTLDADTERACDDNAPQIFDVNFDGAPDLFAPAYSGGGANQTYNAWLYDRRAGRLTGPIDSLLDLADPYFDAKHRIIASHWRNGCCQHGVTLYRWHGTALREIAGATSYSQAVAVGDATYYCYVIPSYKDGHITYPDAVQQGADGRLTIGIEHPDKDCETTPYPGPDIQMNVWKAGTGGTPMLVSHETSAWVRTDTPDGPHYCLVEPVFVDGRIERRKATEDVVPCEKDNPDD